MFENTLGKDTVQKEYVLIAVGLGMTIKRREHRKMKTWVKEEVWLKFFIYFVWFGDFNVAFKFEK